MNKFDVLWFSNTPGLAKEYLNPQSKQKTGTWMNLITKKMTNLVNLTVAFPGNEHKEFTYQDTDFIEVPVRRSDLFSKVVRKIWRRKINLEDYRKWGTKIVDSKKPDVVHFFGSRDPWGIVLETLSVPSVISIQGNMNVYADFYFSGITKWDIFRYGSLKTKLRAFSNYADFLERAEIERKIFDNAENIIGRTDWDRRIASVLAPDAEYHVNDEMLRQEFYNEKWQPRNLDGKINIYTTNRVKTYKGIDTIVKALIILNKQESEEVEFTWRVAGIPEHSWVVNILQKKLTQFPENLEFLGILDTRDIINEIKQSDVYVSPSYIENSPHSLSEAMIMGAPTITTFAGGMSSRLEDGEEGLVVQPGDAYSLAGTILEMIQNYEKAVEYGKQARKTAQKRQNPDKVANNLLKIYQKVLE